MAVDLLSQDGTAPVTDDNRCVQIGSLNLGLVYTAFRTISLIFVLVEHGRLDSNLYHFPRNGHTQSAA